MIRIEFIITQSDGAIFAPTILEGVKMLVEPFMTAGAAKLGWVLPSPNAICCTLFVAKLPSRVLFP